MAAVVVCGAGVIGLASALLLARDGHDVVVLEQDEAAPPDGADPWDAWSRRGVAQFRQPHNLFPGFQRVLDAELPEVRTALEDAGCTWTTALRSMPPPLREAGPRPGDERFSYLTGRRPVVEAAFASVAAEHPRVEVRRGQSVVALLVQPGDPPRVRGVRLDEEELEADLVVDATGRASKVPRLLADAGAPVQVDACDRGFAYYTRYYRGDAPPEARGPGLAAHGSVSVLTILGDRGTWSVTVFGTSRDAPLKALRSDDVFERVLRAFPLQAHWLDGEPVTGVLPMAGVVDRRRSSVLDGRPAVLGLLPVGDAWACTNPSAGRGLSTGLLHARVLRDVVREHPGLGLDLALAHERASQQVVGPWVEAQARSDAQRVAEMEAERDGRPAPPPPPGPARFAAAAYRDPDLFRCFVETLVCLAPPQEVLARPEVADAVARLSSDGVPPPRLPGPDRAELERLLLA